MASIGRGCRDLYTSGFGVFGAARLNGPALVPRFYTCLPSLANAPSNQPHLLGILPTPGN